MKKFNLNLLAMIMIVIPVLQSCNDEEGYSLGNFSVQMATIRVVSGNAYFLVIDNGRTLWPAASDIPWYRPVDGQRVLANFTLLSDNFQGFDHAIKVNYLSNVLTKPIEDLTEENQNEFGNDPISVRNSDVWIGANFLNIRFIFLVPFERPHRVSLVRNTTQDYLIDNDGYVLLELRYNDQNDISNIARRSFVSFNLGEYGPQLVNNPAIKGIKVKINSIPNGEKEVVFTYNRTNTQERYFEYTSDLVNEGVN